MGLSERPTIELLLARLLDRGHISVDDVQRVHAADRLPTESIGAALVRLGVLSHAGAADALAETLGLERVTGDALPRTLLFPGLLSPRFLEANRALPIREDEQAVWLAMADPTDTATIRAVALATRRRVVPVVAAADELERLITRLISADAPSLDQIGQDALGDSFDDLPDDKESLEHLAEAAPVIRFVNQMLADAVRVGTSDIHVEPARDRLRVRFRVHGRLREIGAPPARLAAAVISRIKIMARLDIAERRLPQDGRARVIVDQRRFDLRVATAPAVHGESVVIRLLETDKDAPSFAETGMSAAIEQAVRRQLAAPHGMFLVTGPTGCG